VILTDQILFSTLSKKKKAREPRKEKEKKTLVAKGFRASISKFYTVV